MLSRHRPSRAPGRPARHLLLLFATLCTCLCYRAYAFNTCEEITRCSECVYDETDGLMPPRLLCGWCESSKSCKELNKTTLSYYPAPAPMKGTADTELSEHSPAEMAAFRAQFCEDLRERSFNPVCPDMSCTAAKTTNNIYICRAPPLIALTFACVLFVLSIIVSLWMRTIRQLPWKYEPFLSDLLEGRESSYVAEDCHEEDGWEGTEGNAREGEGEGGDAAPTRRLRRHRHGSPARGPVRANASSTPPPQPLTAHQQGPEDSDAAASEGPSSETASTISNPSYLGAVSHNVVLAHHPRSTPPPLLPSSASGGHAVGDAAATAAATGYCPICKCRQPTCLGPGEVCFWCNVARFTFVPFFVALISSVFVIVLNFAVSLKPWFSDWYFAEVLIIAYASYGGLVWYMVHHHGRAPLFFFESEAERRANQRIWAATHDRPASSVFSGSNSASHPGSAVGSARRSRHQRRDPSPARGDEADQADQHSHPHYQRRHHVEVDKLRLLNAARRNMASTYYIRLAFQLRGRALLTCYPQLKDHAKCLELMQVSPATLTSGTGDVVSAMRAATAPVTPTVVPMHNVPVISPFAGAAAVTAAMDEAPNSSAAAAAAFMNTAASPGSPSLSSTFGNDATNSTLHGALPPLAQLASTPPPPPYSTPAETGPLSVSAPPPPPSAPSQQLSGGAGAAVAPAGGPIGSPAATNVPASLARQKRGETVQLLSSDFLTPQYCKALKATLYRDEYITWCSKPNLHGVLMDNEWLLLDLAVGLLFGVWMLMLSSVTDNTYAIVQLSGSTAVAACGLVVMVCFALLLVIVVRQCGRLYVLTNERLITVYESVITPVTTATDLSAVRFAALYGYRGIWSKKPCLTFSWEVPATERKMPVIKSHKFPGIMHLQEFLYYFHLVAPQTPFHLEQISESTRQDRQEWRLHIFLCVAAFVALPIVTVYPHALPDFLALFLYFLCLVLLFSTMLRGIRAQQMTYAPLNTAAAWAPEADGTEQDEVAPATPPPPPIQQLQPPTKASTTGGAASVATVESATKRHATPTTESPSSRGLPEASLTGKPSQAGDSAASAGDNRKRSSDCQSATSLTATSASTTLPPKSAPATAAAAVPRAPTPPLTSAVREMEESLTGLLGSMMARSSASPNSSFTAAAAMHLSNGIAAAVGGSGAGGGSGSRGNTARNSPHRRRLQSTADLAANSSSGHIGSSSIVFPAAVAAGKTAPSTASTSPTNPAPPSTFVGNLSTQASPNSASGSPQDTAHHRHQRFESSRSGSESAMSARSGESPSVGAPTGSPGGRHASMSHVVPASLRSTHPDGHTHWGDQQDDGEHA